MSDDWKAGDVARSLDTGVTYELVDSYQGRQGCWNAVCVSNGKLCKIGDRVAVSVGRMTKVNMPDGLHQVNAQGTGKTKVEISPYKFTGELTVTSKQMAEYRTAYEEMAARKLNEQLVANTRARLESIEKKYARAAEVNTQMVRDAKTQDLGDMVREVQAADRAEKKSKPLGEPVEWREIGAPRCAPTFKPGDHVMLRLNPVEEQRCVVVRTHEHIARVRLTLPGGSTERVANISACRKVDAIAEPVSTKVQRGPVVYCQGEELP